MKKRLNAYKRMVLLRIAEEELGVVFLLEKIMMIYIKEKRADK